MANKQTKQKNQDGRIMALAYTNGNRMNAVSGIEDTQGAPSQRFVKDMIHVGLYTHPHLGWSLDVTPERMDRWIAAFRSMKENGVDVEVVKDHSQAADDVLGYLQDMFREGDVLYGVHELRGDAAIALASSVKNVSILVEPDFTDGKGNQYGEVIAHSSLVQAPVVPGQSEFIPIAASMAGKKSMKDGAPLLVFTMDKETNDHGSKSMTKEQLETIKKLLGAGDDLTEENAFSRIEERFTSMASEKGEQDKKIVELSAQIESLKASTAEKKPSVDPDQLDMMTEAVGGKIDALVSTGKLTPKAASRAREVLIGAPESRNTFMLSRKVSGTPEAVARQVLSILEQNDPIELGEAARKSAVALSRTTPGGEEDQYDPKVTNEMVEMAGGPAVKSE